MPEKNEWVAKDSSKKMQEATQYKEMFWPGVSQVFPVLRSGQQSCSLSSGCSETHDELLSICRTYKD